MLLSNKTALDIMKYIAHWWVGLDKISLSIILIIMTCGLAMLFSISPAISARIGISSQMHFAHRQLVFVAIGLGIVLFFSMLDRATIWKIAFIGCVICLVLLLLVLFVGDNIKGAKRWFHLSFFTIQPSEILKPFFIIVNAHLLASKTNKYFCVTVSICLLLLTMILLVLEPDFGSCIVYLFLWISQAFLTGASRKLFTFILPLPIILALIGFFLFPHFHNRILTFAMVHLGTITKKDGYQSIKAMEAIRDGDYFGRGLCEGNIKYQLPDSHTDYIVAVMTEELGAVFTVLIICLYCLFCIRNIDKCFLFTRSNWREIKIVICSICIFFSLEVFVNAGVAFNILPSKGMVLPFISYGGSAMIANCIMLGILLSLTNSKYLTANWHTYLNK